jgi:hypothetical protein
MNFRRRNRIKHSKTKAKQRYGLNLTKGIRKNLINLIESGEAQAIDEEKQKNSSKIYMVEYLNQKFKIVYDPLEGCIVTFLPIRENNKYHKFSKAKEYINGYKRRSLNI